jgi:hypothetical protein
MKVKKTIRVTLDKDEVMGAVERVAREDGEIGYELSVTMVEFDEDDSCTIVFTEDP